MIKYPKELDKIFNKLQNYSSKIIIVGGFVRDSLLNTGSKDIDIEVYGIKSFERLEDILKEFGNISSVGKSFGVCKLIFKNYDLDFSLPRSDNKTHAGHRGFEVTIDPNLDFKTATSRRDFTINSIGYDVINKELLDPFNGVADLKNKILKAVDEKSFIQDPLRVLRAAGFCARFELNIDNNLLILCKKMVYKNMLNELPKERIFGEIQKLFLKAKKPSIGFKLLKSFGGDIYSENIYLLDNIKLTKNSKTNIVLMLATLCHNYKTDDAIEFIEKLSDEKDILKRVLPLIQNHQKIKIKLSNYELYKLATEVKIEELLILCQTIYGNKIYKTINSIKERTIKLNILNKKLIPLLRGKNILKLGFKPSLEFSKILNNAYEAQMKGEFSNYLKAKKWLKNYLATHF
ncbi:MAG: CCA tRNA nucleotidyltransferase [Sulfurimonas sp.]|nr:CCA tRNA nucleotidyltransferase [Sulfurimonas sp.]